MREILFRGQHRRKGEKVRLDGSPVESLWIYGSGVLQCKGQSSVIYQTEPMFDKYSVYTETVGQYTGEKAYSNFDDELHKIFEDDLCWVTEWTFEGSDIQHLCQVCFDKGAFYFQDVNSDFRIALYEIDDIVSDVQLIGNIHDNPELLKNKPAKSETYNS